MTSEKLPPRIPHLPRLVRMTLQKIANFGSITNQLDTNIRQHTVLFYNIYNNKVYLLPNTCSWLVWNKYGSDAMHGKCKILSLKITVFRVMKQCNAIDEYQGFGQNKLPPSFDGLGRQTQNTP